MNIGEKINIIRQQPEHIRIRYVWGCVAISMFIILVVWVFSVFSMFGEINTAAPDQKPNTTAEELQQQLQGFKSQTNTLKSLGDQPLDMTGGGISASQSPTDNTGNFNIPQSGNYSNLSNTAPAGINVRQ